MKINNIHSRILKVEKSKVASLFSTLATKEDQVWPKDIWPAIRFVGGLVVGAHGGHGPIKYSVEDYQKDNSIRFRFSKPTGFNGIHEFEIQDIKNNQTRVVHSIKIDVAGLPLLNWLFVIRPLHNALIEDAFDKIENNLFDTTKVTKWNLWVKLLRNILK